jgi:DNA-directed RNA polymerase specialized sigma24 family protein
MIHDPHALLPIAYRAAAQVVRSRVLAEEASERALHQLALQLIQGEPPEHPKAWLRTVARRTACALLNSDWGRTRTIDHTALQERPAPYRRPPASGCDFVRETLGEALSPRQRAALDAAVTCNSTRAAARTCGMQPRDFRRSLATISRKARELLADRAQPDAFADSASVQFQLDP